MFAGDVAGRRGATVHRHSWTQPPPEQSGPELEAWVRGQATPVLDAIGGRPLLIGRSLGTLAAALAADRSLPAVWLTPLLLEDCVVAALERATAPFLLVGGTDDQVWDTALARRLTPHVLAVEGADHGMYVPGPLVRSVDVHGQVVEAVEAFLDSVGWPA
jgi:pimeloyl-ACP methyl ester carboxylesterase